MQRVLIKLSGEYLGGKDKNTSFCHETVREIVRNIDAILNDNIQVAVVVGGGNIVRGESISSEVERCAADQMGMLSTVINGLYLQSVFQKEGIQSALYGSVGIPGICVPFSSRAALEDIESGRVIICVGGTGNPFFTTDTTSVLRALELKCDVVLKATKVDGVYDKDPVTHKEAQRFEEISYKEVLDKQLRVMDLASISLAADNKLPVIVFSLHEKNCFQKALAAGAHKTIIS